MTIQFSRGLLLAKTETTFNLPEALSPTADALEVISPDFTPDITTQRREVVSNDISPFANLVTRKVGRMAFQLEVKNNGNTAGTIAPRIGRLLKACGFTETQINTAAECVFRSVPGMSNVGDLAFDGTTTAYTGGVYLKIKCTIVTGGASGVATAHFEAPGEATPATGGLSAMSLTDTDEVLLTDGVEVTLHDDAGAPIVSITPQFGSSNPQSGDVVWVHVRPIGYLYQPTTDNIESVTMDMQYPDDSGQSVRHRLIGARGTVSINAQVGQFPTFDFEFTGTYVDQVDEPTLTGTFEDQDPTQMQYAALAVARRFGPKYTELCASQWSIDMAVSVAIRDCINAANSTEGAFITGREATVSYDPEAILAVEEPIWSYLENGTSVEWWVRHGTVNGNMVLFHAPNHQLTNIAYGDRNNIRTFNIDGALSRLNGNDELQILFT